MIRTSVLLVRSDLRTEPGRTVAISLLLAAGVVFPILMSGGGWTGVLPAAALAWAASAGATARNQRTARVLTLNGSGPGVPALASAGTMALPGVACTLITLVAGVVVDAGINVGTAIGVGLVVPVLTAAAQSLLGGPRGLRVGNRWMRVLGALVVVLLLVLVPALIFPVVLYLVALRRGVRPGWRRGAITLGAAVLAAAIAVSLGRTDSWWGLSLQLLVLGIPLVIALFRLGAVGVDLAGALGPHLGPRARLATAPLRHRRRAVAPLAMALGLAASLAVMDAVVGASFGQREDHLSTEETVILGRPTLRADQVVVRVSQSDPATVARVAEEETAGTEVRAAVINVLGGSVLSSVSIDGAAAGPGWVGVVTPEDLAALGLEDQVPALARGEAVVLNPTARPIDGQIDLTLPGRTISLAAVASPGTVPATELPGALVSPTVADRLDLDVGSARVVLSPTADATAPPPGLGAMAEAIRRRAVPAAGGQPATTLDPGAPGNLLKFFAWGNEASDPIVFGDEVTEVGPRGPLNDVPYFAGTRAEGTRSLVVIGPICLVLLGASGLLILGATRYEDTVLSENGASPRLRASLAMAQAGLLATGTTLVAAIAGIGLPALAFRTYNQGNDRGALPIIPLVVPWEVPVGLLVLTAAAVASAGLIVATRDRFATATRDDLAW